MHNLDIIEIIIIAICSICAITLISITWYSIRYPYGHQITNPQDLDRQSCQQMRESGWTEDEIEIFMTGHHGFYFKPEE